MRFACLRGYIVATVEDIGYGLPEIQLDELRMFDGHTDEGYDIQYDAFVASDGFVYDLTCEYPSYCVLSLRLPHTFLTQGNLAAMLYGSRNPIYSKFKPFLGGIVADEELKTYLDTHCENLICAVLVQRNSEENSRRIINWDPRKKVARKLSLAVSSDKLLVTPFLARYKMPIWANRPKKIPKLPAENEVAPHIDTIEKIKEVSKEGDFETKDVFEPTPTATFLQNMINQLVPVNQPSLAEGLEKQEHQTTGTSNTKGKEPESRANSSKSLQLSRLEADLRRRKDEKVMREIARTWQEVIASDESTLPAAYPPKNNAKHTSDGVLQEKELEEGERSAQKDAVPPGMSRRALEVTKKRKPVFESDDGPPRKRR